VSDPEGRTPPRRGVLPSAAGRGDRCARARVAWRGMETPTAAKGRSLKGEARVEPSPLKADAISANPAALSKDAQEQLERYIEEEEGAFNRLSGWIGLAIAGFAVIVSLFHLYAAYEIVPAHVLRPTHVGMVLVLCFLLFPMARRFRDRIRGPLHHFLSTGRVNVEERNAQTSRFDCRHRHRVRDVVILQVEKYATALRDDPSNEGGTCRSEQLHTNLEHAD